MDYFKIVFYVESFVFEKESGGAWWIFVVIFLGSIYFFRGLSGVEFIGEVFDLGWVLLFFLFIDRGGRGLGRGI